jgi:type IV secretory pathway VirB3-like protein
MSAFLFFKVELFKMVEVTDVVTGPVGWLTYKRLTSMRKLLCDTDHAFTRRCHCQDVNKCPEIANRSYFEALSLSVWSSTINAGFHRLLGTPPSSLES